MTMSWKPMSSTAPLFSSPGSHEGSIGWPRYVRRSGSCRRFNPTRSSSVGCPAAWRRRRRESRDHRRERSAKTRKISITRKVWKCPVFVMSGFTVLKLSQSTRKTGAMIRIRHPTVNSSATTMSTTYAAKRSQSGSSREKMASERPGEVVDDRRLLERGGPGGRLTEAVREVREMEEQNGQRHQPVPDAHDRKTVGCSVAVEQPVLAEVEQAR